MNRTEILKKKAVIKYIPGYVRGGYSVFSCLVAKQSRAHEHSAAATLSCTRATLCSSSTHTPVVAVLVLLRTARAALERRSIRRFPSMAYCTAKKKDHDHSIAHAQRARHKHEHGEAKPSRAHEHSAAAAAAAAVAPSGTRAILHSSSTRTPDVAVVFSFCCVLLELTRA